MISSERKKNTQLGKIKLLYYKAEGLSNMLKSSVGENRLFGLPSWYMFCIFVRLRFIPPNSSQFKAN